MASVTVDRRLSPRPHAPGSMRRRVLPRRQAGNGLEDPMEMVRAEPGATGQRRQTRHRLLGFDLPTYLGDGCGMPPLERRLGRLAPLAGPEPRALGIGGRQMELHVRGIRKARPARGPAVHAGGFHGVVEGPVRGAIARDDLSPSGIVLGSGGSARRCRSRGQRPHLVFCGCLNHHAPTIAGATIARTSLLAIEFEAEVKRRLTERIQADAGWEELILPSRPICPATLHAGDYSNRTATAVEQPLR